MNLELLLQRVDRGEYALVKRTGSKLVFHGITIDAGCTITVEDLTPSGKQQLEEWDQTNEDKHITIMVSKYWDCVHCGFKMSGPNPSSVCPMCRIKNEETEAD